jgi:hypothetical protein
VGAREGGASPQAKTRQKADLHQVAKTTGWRAEVGTQICFGKQIRIFVVGHSASFRTQCQKRAHGRVAEEAQSGSA